LGNILFFRERERRTNRLVHNNSFVRERTHPFLFMVAVVLPSSNHAAAATVYKADSVATAATTCSNNMDAPSSASTMLGSTPVVDEEEDEGSQHSSSFDLRPVSLNGEETLMMSPSATNNNNKAGEGARSGSPKRGKLNRRTSSALKKLGGMLRSSTNTTGNKAEEDLQVGDNVPATDEGDTATILVSPTKQKKNLKNRLNILRSSTISAKASGDTEDDPAEAALTSTPDGEGDAVGASSSTINTDPTKPPLSPAKKAKPFLGLARRKKRADSPLRNSEKKKKEAREQARNQARSDILGRIGGILGESANDGSTAESGAFLVDSVDASGAADGHLMDLAPASKKEGGRFAKVARKIAKRSSFFMGKKPKTNEQPGMTMMEDPSSELMPTADEMNQEQAHGSLTEDTIGAPQFSLPRPSLEAENKGVGGTTLPRPNLEVEDGANVREQKVGSFDDDNDEENYVQSSKESTGSNTEATQMEDLEASGREESITERRRRRRQQNSVSTTVVDEVVADNPSASSGRGRLRRIPSKLRQSAQSTGSERSNSRDPVEPKTPTRRRTRLQHSYSASSDDAPVMDSSERETKNNELLSSVQDPQTPRRLRRHNSKSKPSERPSTEPTDSNNRNNESLSSVQDPQTPSTRRRLKTSERSSTDPMETSQRHNECLSSVQDPQAPSRTRRRVRSSDTSHRNSESISSVQDPQTPSTRRRGVRRSKSNPSEGASADTENQEPQMPMRRRLKDQSSRSRRDETEESKAREDRHRSRRSTSPSKHAASKSASPTRHSPKADRSHSKSGGYRHIVSPKEDRTDEKSRRDRRSISPKEDRSKGKSRSPTRQEKEHEERRTHRRRHRSGSPGRSHGSSPSNLEEEILSKSKNRSPRGRSREEDLTPTRHSTTTKEHSSRSKESSSRRSQSPKKSSNNDDLLRSTLSDGSKSPTSRRRHVGDRSVVSAAGGTRSRKDRRPKSPAASEKAQDIPAKDELAYHVEKLEVFEWG
jgi:hypothetical protein